MSCLGCGHRKASRLLNALIERGDWSGLAGGAEQFNFGFKFESDVSADLNGSAIDQIRFEFPVLDLRAAGSESTTFAEMGEPTSRTIPLRSIFTLTAIIPVAGKL